MFAEYLDKQALDAISDQTMLPMQVFATTDGDLPKDVQAVMSSLSSQKPVTRALSDTLSAGYMLLDDAAGKPTLVARVEVSRELSAQANKALNYYLLVAGLIVLLLALINGQTVGRLIKKEETITLKDEFFSVASHELRTPLTAIRGNSQLARQMYGQGNKGLTEMMDDIHTASIRLIRIVNNFLDAARLEQGKIPFKLEALSMAEVVSDVVDELQGLASEKSLTILAKLPDGLPNVYADKDRLKQIIYNLVGNAVKFTEEGSIAVSAKTADGKVVVSVEDTGRGMSPESQKALFSRFSQTKQSDLTTGSGLGLYISKLMVEAMKGAIWVASSTPGKGTVISFSVPKSQ
jgi:signal transduction histidine kinase